MPVEPTKAHAFVGCDLARLPYPIALTADRLVHSLETSGDVLKSLFLLKDCFEATIKYFGVVLLAEYRLSPACTAEHNQMLLEKMLKPSLGVWVSTVVGDLSRWLAGRSGPSGRLSELFVTVANRQGGKPKETPLFQRCKGFVDYRNDALGHGARRPDRIYEADLHNWLPVIRELIDKAAALATWRLCLVVDSDRYQVWSGPTLERCTEPGDFAREQIGHFILRGPDDDYRDLYPFLCYLPPSDARQGKRLHFYDSLYRYTQSRKEVAVLEYDDGLKQYSSEPVFGMEETFSTEQLAVAFGRHRGRMEVIEGRVANFGELIQAHAEIIGRRFVIDHIQRFIAKYDRGLLLIQAPPGKGKTALMAHLVEEVFSHYSPPPVHFFYRRTAGITDPDVCVKSLYHALLEGHNLTESEEAKQQTQPEPAFLKLCNLMSDQIATRLAPSRPQLILIDALDEAAPTATGKTAFALIPESLPAGICIIATTRPVVDRTLLARRSNLHWFDLDSPDLLQHNLQDGRDYVYRELAGHDLSNATLDEIARVAAGNFLVLKLLCNQVGSSLAPQQVSDFLRRLVSDGGADQLGFVYAEFWERIMARLSYAEARLLCDIAGVLVSAKAPLTAEIICEVLGLRSGDWEFAFRHLAEYLTVLRYDEDNAEETFFRIYHESFAEFLRKKVAADQSTLENLFADFCLGWSRHQGGCGRSYSLRFATSHLCAAGRFGQAADILCDWEFLEAKAEAGVVIELLSDFSNTIYGLASGDPRHRLLMLLEKSIRLDIEFVAKHPTTLFQCLWNRCCWHDMADNEGRFELRNQLKSFGTGDARGMSEFLRQWRSSKESNAGFCWVRSLRPPLDSMSHAQRNILRGHKGWVKSVAFSPDSKWIAAGGDDDNVLIWDAQTGREQSQVSGKISRGSFSPSGRNIVTTHGVFDVESGAAISESPFIEAEWVSFSPDGRQIVTASTLGEIRFLDARTLTEKQCIIVADGLFDVFGISRMGDRFAAADPIRIFDSSSGNELARLRGHGVQCLAFSPDGRLLVTGSTDRSIRIWDIATTECIKSIPAHARWVWGVAWSSNGEFVASGAEDATVRLWNPTTGEQIACLIGHEGWVKSVDFSADGKLVASGGGDGTVRIWDLSSATDGPGLQGHAHEDFGFSLSRDGRRAVTWAFHGDGVILLWDVGSGDCLCAFGKNEKWTYNVAFSPCRKYVAVGCGDGTVRIWDIQKNEEIARLSGIFKSVLRVVFSEDGQRLAIVSGSGEVAIWSGHRPVWPDRGTLFAKPADFPSAEVQWHDTSPGIHEQRIYVLRTASEVNGVAFTPDGSHLISVGNDQSIRLWDIRRDIQLRCLDDDDQLDHVTICADGLRFVSVSTSGVIKTWDLATWQCLEVTTKAERLWEILSGTRHSGYRAIVRETETVIESIHSGKEIAWFAGKMDRIVPAQTENKWVAKAGTHFYILQLIVSDASET